MHLFVQNHNGNIGIIQVLTSLHKLKIEALYLNTKVLTGSKTVYNPAGLQWCTALLGVNLKKKMRAMLKAWVKPPHQAPEYSEQQNHCNVLYTGTNLLT